MAGSGFGEVGVGPGASPLIVGCEGVVGKVRSAKERVFNVEKAIGCHRAVDDDEVTYAGLWRPPSNMYADGTVLDEVAFENYLTDTAGLICIEIASLIEGPVQIPVVIAGRGIAVLATGGLPKLLIG